MRELTAPVAASRRAARWISPLVVAVVVATLVATTAVAYTSIVRASTTVALGEGDAMLRNLLRLGGPGRPPSPEDLAGFLDDHRDEGLRWVAVLGADDQVESEAGSAAASGGDRTSELHRLRPGIPVEVGSRMRLVSRPPPGPRPPSPEGGPWGGRDRPLGPPTFVIEFEPVVANRLHLEAGATLASGIVAALALIGGSVLLGRRWAREEELERRLEQDRRLASLGEMSAVLAHEIRNPLASLKGHAQLLVESLPDAAPSHAKAERVVNETLRLETLATDLLEFVRVGKIERRATGPVALLRDAAHAVDPERIQLDLARAPATWPLDAARIRQVLVNLLRNAVQASPEGAIVEASASTDGARLAFTVRDHGAGLPPGDPALLFEPFHTTRVHGTGLGLTVARRLVELHGGTIIASNHERGGAIFRIELPGVK